MDRITEVLSNDPADDVDDSESMHATELEPGWRLSATCAAVVAAGIAVWGFVFPSLWPDAGGMPGLGDLVGLLLAVPAVVALLLLGCGGMAAADRSATWARVFFSLGLGATGLAGLVGLIVLIS